MILSPPIESLLKWHFIHMFQILLYLIIVAIIVSKYYKVGGLEILIAREYERWTSFFKSLDNCICDYVKPQGSEKKRLLIASLTEVPWSESLKPQYNESENKIGYFKQYEKGIRLDIDFLDDYISKEDVFNFMHPYSHIEHIKSGRAPSNRSWWRYVEGDSFNTLQLVVRNDDLGTINIDNDQSREFFQKVIDGVV